VSRRRGGLAAGVDGCHAGWFCVMQCGAGGNVRWSVHPDATALLRQSPAPRVLAIDIPIGLPEMGPRECDREARRLIGPRRSSVFPAPIRAALAASSWREACAIRWSAEAKKVSQQAWNIVGKVRETDDALRADAALRRRVVEVHPEASFCFMNRGTPLCFGKKSAEGRAERLALLRRVFGDAVSRVLTEVGGRGAASDDVLDAFAALWTAERILAGRAVTLPATAPRDRFGLPMRIVV
jgi:predicted RNase H-like nuclease